MKVKIRKSVLALVLAALFLSGSTVSASSFDTTIYVGTNQNWSYSQWVSSTINNLTTYRLDFLL